MTRHLGTLRKTKHFENAPTSGRRAMFRKSCIQNSILRVIAVIDTLIQ